MAPATCSRDPRSPRTDPSRNWVALGAEASGTVAGSVLLGLWLRSVFDHPLPLVALSVAGVAAATWRLLRNAR